MLIGETKLKGEIDVVLFNKQDVLDCGQVTLKISLPTSVNHFAASSKLLKTHKWCNTHREKYDLWNVLCTIYFVKLPV